MRGRARCGGGREKQGRRGRGRSRGGSAGKKVGRERAHASMGWGDAVIWAWLRAVRSGRSLEGD